MITASTSAPTDTTADAAPMPPPFRDPDLPLDERVHDLVARLTLEEKVSQMEHGAAAIPRLGIPAYNYWNECLHGVARNGRATVFPQIIGLAATWDTDLIHRVATAISDEARAKHHAALARQSYTQQYQGLTFWTPNINLFRDPRWGRGQETWGEDPHLTATLAATFVRGLQGDTPDTHLKLAACAKHYAVHSGPENERHTFNARVTPHDLWDSYLPAFEHLVRHARVESVMGAYNRTLDEPCCASQFLLLDILRERWGFDGHVVSDCWALRDIHETHRITTDPVESAALALTKGCDLACGTTFELLGEAVHRGLITEADIDRALSRHLRARFKLGMFDPVDDNRNPWSSPPPPETIVACPAHTALAYEAAVASCVLLKNRDNILPLRPNVRSLYITGPLATTQDALLGNYYGLPPRAITILDGLAAALPEGIRADYRPGALLSTPKQNTLEWAEFDCAACDVTIACLGLTALLEGEEGEAIASPHHGDRDDITLPPSQRLFLENLIKRKARVIVILFGGSALSLGPLADHVEAILWAGYPGQEGGRALADILLGRASPSGRLPITFYENINDLPPYADYSMRGRTHRWFEGTPAWPFGFGLTYTRFTYTDLQTPAVYSPGNDTPLRGSVLLTNTGDREGNEIVQVYLTGFDTSDDGPIPKQNLADFHRVTLAPGQSRRVNFTIPIDRIRLVDTHGRRTRNPRAFTMHVGGSSPHPCAQTLGAPAPQTARIRKSSNQ
ncbi:glycoside hydrolase family 3 protein [Opitutaceae bacterium TAV3]|nr:glycoside hydrolase family 3 protein [Opitutaceae bacterium TAV3]